MAKKHKLKVTPKKKEKTDLTEHRRYQPWTSIDEMFNRFRSDLDTLIRSPWTGLPVEWSEYRTPSTDIADQGDKYEVHVEMPGIPKDKINIEVTPNNIEISADYEESTEEEEKNWLKRERSSMSYYRNFSLPEEIKSDQVDAELKNGILRVMLPKQTPTPEPSTKKVKVK